MMASCTVKLSTAFRKCGHPHANSDEWTSEYRDCLGQCGVYAGDCAAHDTACDIPSDSTRFCTRTDGVSKRQTTFGLPIRGGPSRCVAE